MNKTVKKKQRDNESHLYYCKVGRSKSLQRAIKKSQILLHYIKKIDILIAHQTLLIILGAPILFCPVVGHIP